MLASNKNVENYQIPNKLKLIAIINIIFIIANLFLIPLRDRGPWSIMHDIINDIYDISIRGLFGLFPYIITFGVLMFNFGRVNQKEFGFYLKISGILGIIGYGLSIITISLIYIPIGIFSNLLLPFSYGGSIIIFGCYVFITFHGIKNKDRNLKIFGSLYLIGFILSTLVGIILAILFPLELI